MGKTAFIGFGEVNTPKEIIIKKCAEAAERLEKNGLELIRVFPVTDDYEETDIRSAVSVLEAGRFDSIVICIAGWIPSHAVIKITEHFRHIPMVLWGLCGWTEDGGRLVTTADQAGTSALRAVFDRLGYIFTYVYDIIGLPSGADRVVDFCRAACAAEKLRHARVGMAGYRDMNLYGTLCDGVSLKKVTGVEIETFELLEMVQRKEKLNNSEIAQTVSHIDGWRQLKPVSDVSKRKAAEWYLSAAELVSERGYDAVSLKDVDGMKKLLGYPPAPVFMLLDQLSGVCTVPENDCLGSVTQLMVKYLTGQCAAYLEFYEFFSDGVLAGVPDYIPQEITEGEIPVMPAAFGELDEGILNVSKVKPGRLTMCRLYERDGKYSMHMTVGEGIAPGKWEEAGWTQPAPQLPGLEIRLENTRAFAENVMCQHYIISYGDNRGLLRDLCRILGIGVLET
ncbi:uncharacterized protein BN580_01623 [Candidatus Colimorpha enterica]|uniref:L-fucose isomerase C-terminal domain-containing protein n=1 Tax=Candidatus Colimorpha enterica TaxID=3083063 RepID=R6UVN8_9BACT|nr:uncharacterized protein BN580_01623 [Candidatus Colimorpha enterica]